MHAVNAPLSRRHATAIAPPVVNVSVAVVELVAAGGPPVIVTVGGTVSIVQVNVAVDALPTGSDARTVKLWLPSARAPVANPGVHAASAPASTAHSKVAVVS